MTLWFLLGDTWCILDQMQPNLKIKAFVRGELMKAPLCFMFYFLALTLLPKMSQNEGKRHLTESSFFGLFFYLQAFYIVDSICSKWEL